MKGKMSPKSSLMLGFDDSMIRKRGKNTTEIARHLRPWCFEGASRVATTSIPINFLSLWGRGEEAMRGFRF